uniref:CSON007399 protein n=1 Tax=Culicoides sonorensis TaxID=179676 RepID=A0A336K315_CULSO
MKFISSIFLLCALHCVTSQKALESRIYGGVAARANEFPFMISLQVDGVPFCGGTLITSSFILTTVSCGEQRFDTGPKMAVAGGHVFDTERPRPNARVQSIEIFAFYNHPDYANNPFLDLALARTRTPFTLNRYVLTISLASPGVFDNRNLIIAGWGGITRTDGTPRYVTLRKAIVQVSTCRIVWAPTPVGDNDLCVQAPIGKPSPCAGDEGGPLIRQDAVGKYSLVGVIRYVPRPCGISEKGAIIMDVRDMEQIITNIITSAPPIA